MSDFILTQTGEQVQDAIDRGLDIHNLASGEIPKRTDSNVSASNITEDPDGKLRASEEILAEEGIDTTPATVTLGDALKVEGSGGQQVNRSSVTGKRYQVIYQEFDKTGAGEAFKIDLQAEVVNEVRQADDSTALTSGVPFTITTANNEVVNAVYLKTNNTVENFRYQVKSLETNEIVDSYPDKFKYEKDEGVTLSGADTHKIDLYYTENSTPNRYLSGENIEITMKWGGSGNLLGNSSGDPYYAYDYQIFTFVNLSHNDNTPTAFTDLTDTPSDHNTAGIWNVVNNPFAQRLEYKQAEFSDNADAEISNPADGEILEYDSGIAKWINKEPRLIAALQSFNTVDDVDTWQDSGLSVLFANDNDIVNTDTPSTSRENDLIIAFNMNTQFGKDIVLNARAGETINGAASYTISTEKITLFVKQGTEWKFGGENDIITTLSNRSVTELNDVTSVGSGAIISTGERATVAAITDTGSGAIITDNERSKLSTSLTTYVDSGSTEFAVRPKLEAGDGIEIEEKELTTDTVVITNTKNLVVEDGATSVGTVDTITFAGGATVVDKGSGDVEVDVTGGSGVGITVRNDTGGVANNVTDLQFVNCLLSSTPPEAQFTPLLKIGQIGGDYTLVDAKEVEFLPPLEVNDSGGNIAQVLVKPGSYEPQHAPSYYASLSEETEIVGLTSSGVRTGVLWFDNVIKPAGTYIQIDRNAKAIGLQEDDTLDPNVTGGTPYLIYTKIALKGEAPADGYVQLFLRDKLTQDIVEDDSGNPLAVRRSYKSGEKLGALDLATIKKFTGIQEFQICVDENFGLGENLVIEDRTEGNSCVLVQAINTSDQTSRGVLQCENDLGKNFEWTAHYLGDDLFTVQYFLKEDRPLTTITPGTGETGADGWHLDNFTNMKVGVSADVLTLEDDGSNLLGFSFGKIVNSEKTQLLRNKVINAFITTTTPEGAGRVYAAKWTGAPDQYTKEIITDIDPAGEPVMAANWVLDGTSIFCTENASGNPATYSGAFTVPTDSVNYAIFFAPEEKQQPNSFEISDFHADVATPFNGYFLHAPEEAGESHLIKDTKYFECGLNTEGYASLRYTINTADTPMPSGKLVKGAADITPNWSSLGAAVDFLTFNENGDADISTTYNVYPGESIAPGGSSEVNFWWAYENPVNTWNKIAESELTITVNKTDQPTLVTTPRFTYKAKNGDKLRAYASADINDGAYIQTTSPHVFLCETTINFEEFVPGSEDEPLTTLYVQDELQNDWELTAATDGHLQTLLVGDLPENLDHHVLRSNFSGSDFVVDGSGIITLVEKQTATEYTEISADTDLDDFRNYIVDTTSNTVTINIPYEQVTAFTVRDEKKEFDTNNCIITVRDEFDAIAHTATLDKRDKGYIFYYNGVNWRYGEIGKGLIVDIASDHVATTDFGDIYTDTQPFDCRVFNTPVCYSSVATMSAVDEAFTSKKYVDDTVSAPMPMIDSYLSTNLSVPFDTETVVPFDSVTLSFGITVSAGEFTVPVAGRYSGHAIFQINEDRDPITYIWVERKPTATGIWELLDNMIVVKAKEDGTYILPGNLDLEAGDIFRVKMLNFKSDATLDLESATKVLSLGTLTQPSASIHVMKIK